LNIVTAKQASSDIQVVDWLFDRMCICESRDSCCESSKGFMTTKKVHMVLKVVMPWYPQRTDAIVSSRVTVPIEKALRDHVKISSHLCQMLGI
jgi:hypothetical protein